MALRLQVSPPDLRVYDVNVSPFAPLFEVMESKDLRKVFGRSKVSYQSRPMFNLRLSYNYPTMTCLVTEGIEPWIFQSHFVLGGRLVFVFVLVFPVASHFPG